MSDIFSALRWWFVLMGIGAVALPLCLTFFGDRGRLPSLGYAFAKPFGLLLITFVFWLFGSFGFVANSTGGIVFAVLVVAAASLWANTQRDQSLRATLRDNWKLILATELLFLVLFGLWSWVRAQNPSVINTEKPMEFAFLNAASRSPVFPPLDPWLSGFGISYYYFGYVMVSVLARLSAVHEAVAFNLGVAWLFAATGVGAFGLIYDLVALSGERMRRWAMGLGLLGALALPLAGNLQIILEVAYANGIGSQELWRFIDIRDVNALPAEFSADQTSQAYITYKEDATSWNGLAQALTNRTDHESTDTPRYTTSGWWWWRTSRVINEYHLSGRHETGLTPIAEIPSFSFVLGDMHPHVLALPFAFLSLAVALTWYLRFTIYDLRFTALRITDYVHFLLTAIIIGGLSFLNTWDVLIHLFVVGGAVALASWRDLGRWEWSIFGRTTLFTLALGIAAYILYLPFYIGFSSQAGAPFILPMLMQPTRLSHFLVMFGMPLLVIVTLLSVLVAQQRGKAWRQGLQVSAGLLVALLGLMLLMGVIVAGSADGAGRVTALATENGLDVALPDDDVGIFGRIGWSLSAITTLTPTILQARLATPLVTLLLLALIGLCVTITSHQLTTTSDKPCRRVAKSDNTVYRIPYTENGLPFLLLLILTASLLTLGPEFVYLRDNFGQRINTVFKFYYQAWVMFGVAGVVGLAYLAQKAKVVAVVATVGYLALFVGALLFPFYAVQSRALEYGGEPTLSGLAYLENGNTDELAALEWLRNEVDGTPVMLEAVGGAYSEYARVAASTGLPTVLGWANHEYQWRGTTEEPGKRDPIVNTIYTQTNWEGIPALLDQYDITYVYVGHLERRTYGEQGIEKFNANMEIAYQNSSVTIYAWDGG